MKKSLLIVGGGGFFGKSILDFMLKKKGIEKKIKEVIVITKSSNISFSKKFKEKFLVKHVKLDITKTKTLPSADIIIYCVISHNYQLDHKGVKNFYKIAKKIYKNSKIIYTSSGAVYGRQKKINLNGIKEIYFNRSKEKFKNLKKEKYAKIKIQNELIFKKLLKNQIKVSIVRCFAFVGKHIPLKSNFVAGNFIYDVINRHTIHVKSKYKILRTYMHGNDLSDCLLKIGLCDKKKYEIYNIGSDDIVDIHQLAIDLGKKYNLKVKFDKKFKNITKDIYVPSISKFRKNYMYEKKFNSFKAINETISEII